MKQLQLNSETPFKERKPVALARRSTTDRIFNVTLLTTCSSPEVKKQNSLSNSFHLTSERHTSIPSLPFVNVSILMEVLLLQRWWADGEAAAQRLSFSEAGSGETEAFWKYGGAAR